MINLSYLLSFTQALLLAISLASCGTFDKKDSKKDKKAPVGLVGDSVDSRVFGEWQFQKEDIERMSEGDTFLGYDLTLGIGKGTLAINLTCKFINKNIRVRVESAANIEKEQINALEEKKETKSHDGYECDANINKTAMKYQLLGDNKLEIKPVKKDSSFVLNRVGTTN